MTGTASAGAKLTPPVIDCQQNGALTRHYTAAQLQEALSSMPSSVEEYSNCENIIQEALYHELGKRGGAGTSADGSGSSSGGGTGFVVVIVVIAVIVLVGGGGAYFAWRRRRSGSS